jgi:8-oxo-dGTP pyrophosphatase MutT (NUDIX family)
MSKEEHLCTIIVAVIIFDDQDRLLMTQEAKESCYGKWYIPAGRVEFFIFFIQKVQQGEHIR